jgi:hypothetical protein
MSENSESKPIEIWYFQAGSEFFNQNYVLLGYHVTDLSQAVGEIDDEVRAALNELAIATAQQMIAIMRRGPVLKEAEV